MSSDCTKLEFGFLENWMSIACTKNWNIISKHNWCNVVCVGRVGRQTDLLGTGHRFIKASRHL